MTSTVTAAFFYLFGWIVMTAVLSWTLAAAYPFYARTLSETSAASASGFVLMYGLLPPAAALVALTLLSLPAVSFPMIADHCHDQTCTPHALHMTTETPAGLISIILAVVLLTGVVSAMIGQLRQHRHRLNLLNNLSERRAASYRVIESPDCIAWCGGLLKPQIYLTRGLLDSLSPSQVRVILAHEQLHAARRDNLRKWLLNWATSIWPSPPRKAIRQAFSNYCELSCDLAAVTPGNGQAYLRGFEETLASCTSSAYRNADYRQARIQSIERELARQDLNTASRERGRLKPAMVTTGLWLLAIIAAVHFGHPLLEKLIQ